MAGSSTASKKQGHLPIKLDEGVPDDSVTREWLENVLTSGISPTIPDLRILQIPGNTGRSYYAVGIPKSYSGPHQAPSKRYYKRYNFKSAPMDDYEIRDIQARQLTLSRLVAVDLEIEHSIYFMVTVVNPGKHPAEDVSFTFSEELAWKGQGKPRVFEKGIKYLPPGRKFKFLYLSGSDLLGDVPKGPIEFSVTAEYMHPELQQRHAETFYFDFRDFLGSSGHREPFQVISDEVKKGFKEIVRAVKSLK